MKYTLYRATKKFMSTLNHDDSNLNLHRNRSHEGLGEEGLAKMVATVQEMLDKGHLIPAATVTTEFDGVYELTNTIQHNWIDNEGVEVIDESAFLSSTSVGDIFTDENNQAYIVTCFEIAPVEFNFKQVA